MPLSYRRYEGVRTHPATRWWPITRTGVAIAWRSKLLRRLVFLSFLPFVYFGWVFFAIGRLTDPTADLSTVSFDMIEDMLGRRLVSEIHANPADLREAVWAMVFGAFAKFAQPISAALVVAIVGPPLVANNLRSRTFLIYFSRPISPLDYVLGKAGVLIALLSSVTVLPAVTLYALSILFSPSLDTLVHTAPILATSVAAWLAVIVPVSLIALTLSSLTRQPRFATAAWFVLCLFGPLAHMALQQTPRLSGSGWTFLLSLPHTVWALHLGLYDVDGRFARVPGGGDLRGWTDHVVTTNSPGLAFAWLALLSVLCLILLLRRVDSPTRI